MNDSHVAVPVPEGIEITGQHTENKKKAMKARDLEKYFGVLKDSETLDEMREQILRNRDLQD